jgi:hypothetical protein
MAANGVRNDRHRSEFSQGTDALPIFSITLNAMKIKGLHLPNDGALKYDQHEESEYTVIPILIQAPKSDAENLKDEEWCCRLLSKQFGE